MLTRNHERKGKAMKTELYTRVANNGRIIGKATRVVFADGYKVDFTERLPKRLAIPQAIAFRNREEK